MSKQLPLVSVIVPTYNSANFLEACLKSIQNQTYKNIELIVVDNSSTDATKTIAKKYTDKVYNRGPERSAQRNYGAKKSRGDFLLFIDADMELTPEVVKQCVDQSAGTDCQAVIIPEESFGKGFWARCKALERSFYVGVDWMEAARFFNKAIFMQLKGYDISMVSGEDWDLSQKFESKGPLMRATAPIMHNEGRLRLLKLLQKKAYYAKEFRHYTVVSKSPKVQKQTSLMKRYGLYFSKPRTLFKSPLVGMGMLLMKTLEFVVGSLSYMLRRR